MVTKEPFPVSASVVLGRAEHDLLERPARRIPRRLVVGILGEPAQVWAVAHELERRRRVFEDLLFDVHLPDAPIEDV